MWIMDHSVARFLRSGEGISWHGLPKLLAVVAVSFAPACSNGDVGQLPAASDREALTQEAPQTPPVPEEITIASVPNAPCTLYSPDAEATETLPVWADDVGLVHLWAAPDSTPGEFTLECEEPDGITRYAFDLWDPATFTPATPRVLPTSRKTLPALTDPMSMTQEEIVVAGYPARPDPVLAPSAYEHWLKTVSRPMTFIPPNSVEIAGIHFDPVTNTTTTLWSGSVLKRDNTHYAWAVADITVPTCSNPSGYTSSKLAMWTGLDGYYGTDDIIQDGIFYNNPGGVGTFQAWYEYLPNLPVFNTTMVVSAGDSMTFWAWEGNSSCTLGSGNTGYGCFWYKNNTTNVTGGTFTVTAPNGLFTGTTAEFIIERVSGATVSSFTCCASMNGGAYDVTSGTWRNATTDPYYSINLVNSSSQVLVSSAKWGQSHTVWQWWRAQ